jgi:hypothetical protein
MAGAQVCGARGPRPRYPRVWKTDKRIGTVSKSQKLVKCVRFLYISLLYDISRLCNLYIVLIPAQTLE